MRKVASIGLLGLLFLCFSCTINTDKTLVSDSEFSFYSDSILTWRKNHDKELKNGVNSPLEKDKIEKFVGLNYFAPIEEWNITAGYKKMDSVEIIEMPTTTERVIKMAKDGYLHFDVAGVTHVLYVYRYMDHPEADLFVPFLDLTNGDESYGGGRYVEVKEPSNDSIIIDFNMAYNPYCAYNFLYSCPIPPLDNTLYLKVEAGEKVLYHY